MTLLNPLSPRSDVLHNARLQKRKTEELRQYVQAMREPDKQTRKRINSQSFKQQGE